MKLAEGYGIGRDGARFGCAATRRSAIADGSPAAAKAADAHHLTQPHPEGEGAARHHCRA